jgi:hypothetical protein
MLNRTARDVHRPQLLHLTRVVGSLGAGTPGTLLMETNIGDRRMEEGFSLPFFFLTLSQAQRPSCAAGCEGSLRRARDECSRMMKNQNYSVQGEEIHQNIGNVCTVSSQGLQNR